MAFGAIAPVLLAPIYLRERWSTVPFYGAPLIVGILLVVLGAMAVGRTHAVSLLLGGGEPARGARDDLGPALPADAASSTVERSAEIAQPPRRVGLWRLRLRRRRELPARRA